MLGGKIVDNLMDKFAQKLSAQEMIRANEAAEAAEQDRIKKQAEAYEKELTILKENMNRLQKGIDTIADSSSNNNIDITPIKEQIDSILKKLEESDEKTYDVGVRTWRNVEASIQQANDKQIPALKQALSDENVKTLEEIKGEFKKLSKCAESIEIQIGNKNNGVLPVTIITLVIAVADLVILLLHIYGIM